MGRVKEQIPTSRHSGVDPLTFSTIALQAASATPLAEHTLARVGSAQMAASTSGRGAGGS
jgi:hypothetical protein